jgi:hypothetical protein
MIRKGDVFSYGKTKLKVLERDGSVVTLNNFATVNYKTKVVRFIGDTTLEEMYIYQDVIAKSHKYNKVEKEKSISIYEEEKFYLNVSLLRHLGNPRKVDIKIDKENKALKISAKEDGEFLIARKNTIVSKKLVQEIREIYDDIFMTSRDKTEGECVFFL